jgi:aromatic ring-opening dioxygenase catalytic subunit (LigB family)
VLIIGSGLSFHNMREFFNPRSNTTAITAFDNWLQESMVDLVGAERSQKLIDWEDAPGARYCHPRV